MYTIVNVLHEFLGHPSKVTMRMMGKNECDGAGTFQWHKGCILGKAKKANVSKTINKLSNIPGEWLLIDVSSPTATSLGGKNIGCWLMIVLIAHGVIFLKKKVSYQTKLTSWWKSLK